MFYYLYQITNLVNNKIYVGVHKTKSLDDGYMGSGKIIRSAIAKHGISNFSKVILEHFDTSESMYAREAEVVNDEFLLREDVYNLRRGGYGGFNYINKNGLNKWYLYNPIVNPFYNKEVSKKGNKQISVLRDSAAYNTWYMSTRKTGMTPETNLKARMASLRNESKTKRITSFKNINHQQGKLNSQFGSIWITNDVVNKKIKKSDSIPNGYRIGRVCNKRRTK